MANKTDRLTIRCSQEFNEKLTALADLWHINRTQVLERLVYAEWLKSTEMGHEKIKELQDVFGNFQNALNEIEVSMNGE